MDYGLQAFALMSMKISLVIPCYNEETNIQKGVLDKVGNYVEENDLFGEVLIVDDGSTDNSRAIIKKTYLNKYKKFRLIENQHGGKAYAVITGIQKAAEEYVMFMDIDLATPIEESEKLIEHAKKNVDIVIGSRSSSREGAPFLRKVMAVGFIIVRNIALGLRNIRDTQCGFKLFRRTVAVSIIDRMRLFRHHDLVSGSSVSAAFDLEFLFLATKLKYSIKEVPVTWRHVETKNVSFIHDTFETLKDIATIMYFNLTKQYESN